MNAQIRELIANLDDARGRVHRLADGVTDDEWRGRHPKGGWSPAECVAHLNISAREMLPPVREAVQRGRRDGILGEGPYSMSVLGGLLCWFLEPPYRMRVKTGARFEPAAEAPKADVMDEFDRAHEEILASVRDAEGLDLSRLRIVSPFDQRMNYNLYTAFRIIPAHVRRHAWQAEQVVAARRDATRPAGVR